MGSSCTVSLLDVQRALAVYFLSKMCVICPSSFPCIFMDFFFVEIELWP